MEENPPSPVSSPKEYPTAEQRRILWSGITAASICAQLAVAAFAFIAFTRFLCWSYSILLPLGLAVIVALVLDPIVGFLQRRGVKRTTSTLLVSILVVVGFLLFWAFVLPPLVSQTGGFVRTLPDSMQSLAGQIRTHLDGYPGAQNWFDTNFSAFQKNIPHDAALAVTAILAPVGQAFGFILGFGFVPIYVYYFLADQDFIARHWHEYVPLRRTWLRDEAISVIAEINRSLVAYFRGQIVVAGVNGLLTFAGLMLIPRMPYALVLGIIAGSLSIVPFLGIITSIVPALLLAFLSAGDPTGRWLRPLMVLLVFTTVQMSESLFVTPRVQSHSTGLHPLAIIVGILFWSLLLPGLLGPVVAVPLTCAVVVLLRRYVWSDRKLIRPMPSETPPPSTSPIGSAP